MEGYSENLRRISSSKIKTYSRKTSRNAEEPFSKRKRAEEIISVNLELPQVKKVKPVSIIDYFKSSTISSSTLQLKSSQSPLKTANRNLNPPLLPTSGNLMSDNQRTKRRLTTRPNLPEITKINDTSNRSTITPDAAVIVTRKFSLGPLVQTQLAPTRTVCSKCKMMFDNAIPSDIRTHEKFHNQKMNGIFSSESRNKGIEIWTGVSESKINSSIRTMDRNCNPAWRSYFEEALRYTWSSGLPACPIVAEDLWAAIPDPHDQTNPVPVPTYKFYVKTVDNKLVALLLAKRAKESGWYFNGMVSCLPHPDGWVRKSLVVPENVYVQQFICHDEKFPAYMSIDHIWVAESHRRTGCATQLLDFARDHFIPGRKLTHEDICFSIPTVDGGKFARTYCNGKRSLGNLDHEHTCVRVNLEEPGPIVKDGYLQGKYQDSLAERATSYIPDYDHEDEPMEKTLKIETRKG